ncbi:GNAT family N-acetyltransferase [Pedobacter sp. NJ-S-72]
MKNLDFSNFPQLSTSRLKLRKLEDADAPAIHELRSDPAVNKFIGRTASTGITDALTHIAMINKLIQNNSSVYWAITLKDTLIGTICLWNIDIPKQTVEIGYELIPGYQGKGLMTEAIKAVIHYGFEEIKAEIITAFPSTDNISSVKILENNGFKLSDEHYANSHETVENILTYLLKK